MARGRSGSAGGLAALRRSGGATELLFLYECATLQPTRLRPVADHLGLTVQAASHAFRQLAAAGLVEVRDGRYRPTVRGTATLHAALDRLHRDVGDRLARLRVVRSTRAVAREALRAGDPVSLELNGGILSARRGGTGPSRGRARIAASAGTLVEVEDLDGIVPIDPGRVTVYALTPADLVDPRLRARLAAAARRAPGRLIGAEGLEAAHLLGEIVGPGLVRFAVASSARAASQVGVASTIVVVPEALADLLAAISGPNPLPFEVRELPAVRPAPGRVRRPGPGRPPRRAPRRGR